MAGRSSGNLVALASLAALIIISVTLAAEPTGYFAIRVLDEDTGRGVPLVEIRTVSGIAHVTDSNGAIAFFEPGLMGIEVYFHVQSHGYQYPADGFGYRGVRLTPVAGGSATLKLKRLNIAERLRRLTGEGIYRDSVLLGLPAPLREPVLSGKVAGQDSACAAVYRGKVFWIWGDTSRPAYPLGNFGSSGAVSELPANGGLDPATGIDFTYFAGEDGFSRPMVPSEAVPGPGPKWLSGLVTLNDDVGRERLIAAFVRVKNLGEMLERGLVAYDDERAAFTRLARLALDEPLRLDGHPFRVEAGGATYFYCGFGPPYAVRVRADWKAVQDPSAYEGFTCLEKGTRYAKKETRLERDRDGRLVHGWKPGTPPLGREEQEALIASGAMRREEAWLPFRDVDSGKPVKPHGGSIAWNAHRRRWVAIFAESGGTSFLGETWYAEADTPIGPWAFARKVITHDRYSFYNPVHHPFFDAEGGRLIYFEGTYCAEFSGNPERTPRYDYNQVLYRLDLADPRLGLPAPVYEVRGEGGRRYMLREGVEADRAWDRVAAVPFFAVPPDRKRDGLAPVYAWTDGAGEALATGLPDGVRGEVLFLAAADDKAAGTVPLHEFRDAAGARRYTTRAEPPGDGWRRSESPACRVWESPPHAMLIDRGALPAR
jgi:hypothetical protein